MINIIREGNSPTSLTTPEIMKYIEDLQNHISEPTTFLKPDKPGSYRNSDLLGAFDRCFHSKCYLTEQWFPNSWCLDVEHFISQTEDPTLRYNWTNLYPAEHRANKMKPRATPDGGYLDPCNPNHDVENEILYSVGVMAQNINFAPADNTSSKALNTTELLNRIHNGHDENTKLATAGLRLEIQKKYDLILNLIIDWLACTDNKLKHQYELQIKSHLSRKSSFTMLMRSMPAVINYIPDDFLD